MEVVFEDSARIEEESEGTKKDEVEAEVEAERAKGPVEVDGVIADPPPAAGEDFEVRKPRIGRRPDMPTKADIDAHFPLH